MKAGSLDNYLLTTHPKDIDSKFGLHLRSLIREKKKNPEYKVPYIQGTATMQKTRKTSVWEYKQVPAIYMPAHVKVGEDHAKFYLKSPGDMSRHEISQLE